MRRNAGRRFLRPFFIFFLFSCLTLFAAEFGEAAGQPLRVTVPRVVRVEGQACVLSDIAALEGPSSLTERAGALLLLVRDGVLTRQQVIDALKVSGLEGVRVELKMPVVVTVESAAPVGEGGAIDDEESPGQDNPEKGPAEGENSTEELSSAIKGLAAWDGDVEVRRQGALPPGRLVSPGSIVPGTPSATLKFRDEAGRERSLAVRLAWYQSALVLARSVKRDEVLRESDFVVRRIRISRPGLYASRPAEVVGRTLRKNLSQGEPIALNSVVGVPIIEKGKGVMIVVHNGGLTVRTKGEALEDGFMGETIRVRNLSSKVVLSAVVVGKDTVEVKVP
ncbi:MAG: flagellar basal body P-ring formation chaperone FlgA [Synergistaceae bacterium]|jgi:flagella basal body P-ring formation protein FlgA|nr:flagellar basal body P-ring formation chaperone FlgA [Synergistaceae bacterium]